MWSTLKEKNSRMLLTIPFGSSTKEMKGFVSVTGEDEELSLTICVQNVHKEKYPVTNMVFPDTKTYLDFVPKPFEFKKILNQRMFFINYE